jgi:AhpD family alkylhydroperoxidase
MGKLSDDFNAYRSKMNERLMEEDNLVIKRMFNIDTRAYEEGALPVKTKELIGLVASLVLRCDDCVKYHLGKCHELMLSKEEVMEAMSIGLLVGGSIVIPHLRRAVEFWDDLSN